LRRNSRRGRYRFARADPSARAGEAQYVRPLIKHRIAALSSILCEAPRITLSHIL
jgi:hypothetical protein